MPDGSLRLASEMRGQNAGGEDPFRYWYDNLGRHLHAGRPDEAWRASALTALTRNYPMASKASTQRLGGGKAMSLTTDHGSVLMADIAVSVPSHIDVRTGEWRTVENWIADVILHPPADRFLFILYGRKGGIESRLRFSTADVVSVCGVDDADSMCLDTATVRSALLAVQGIPKPVWGSAMRLMQQRDRGQGAAGIDKKLDEMIAVHPALDHALDVLPAAGTDDFRAVEIIARELEEGRLTWNGGTKQ